MAFIADLYFISSARNYLDCYKYCQIMESGTRATFHFYVIIVVLIFFISQYFLENPLAILFVK